MPPGHLGVKELCLPACKNLGVPTVGNALSREVEARLGAWHSTGSWWRVLHGLCLLCCVLTPPPSSLTSSFSCVCALTIMEQ